VLTGANLWFHANTAPVGPGEARVVEVPIASDTLDIGSRLQHEGLVRNGFAFQVGIRRWGLAWKLQAGYYRLSPTMSAKEIAEVIASGKTATEKVAVPEGFTVKQIAERLDKTGICKATDFLAAAVPGSVSDVPLPTGRSLAAQSLEGYLFPATYVLGYGKQPVDYVQEMTGAFRLRVVDGLAGDLRRDAHTLHEIVTVASLIEREARVDKDRPLIASVIYNRLKKGMRLQIDATVLYALGEHKERVTHNDLKVDSPFNTYRHKGLPPHPICNPGEASIRAALHPAKSDYLFYVARPDGSHVFTRTYAEHQKAIRAIRGG